MATAHTTLTDPLRNRPGPLHGGTLVLILGLLVGLNGCMFDKSGLPYAGDQDGGVGPDAGDANAALCGNGNLDQGEDCDGNEFGGQTCTTLGHDSGDLTCTSGCQINSSGCSTCGDAVTQGDELCDGSDLANSTCQSLGFDGGSLSCGASCVFDTSLCSGSGCGDGVIDTGEQCDGANLDNETCSSMGYTGGVLSCDVSCQLDTSSCDTCGDDVQTGLEDCDGTDMDGVTCVALGHDGGNLVCAPGCVFDESDCANCGNDVAEPGEDCDGVDLAGADCLTQGFDGGGLSCGTTCVFDTSACTTCGDGQLDAGEECDSGAANSDVTPDACRTNCMNPSCGDGVCDTPELGGNCTEDCRVVVFSDDFDGAWPNGWATGDEYPDFWTQDDVDTWEPAGNSSHSGPNSLWCAGQGNETSNYDNNMGSWAVHGLDLSSAAGLDVYYELWLDVHVTDGDDYLAVTFSPDGGSNWSTLEAFNGDTGGFVFRSYDISAAAGASNAIIGLYFYSDGWDSGAHGAYVDDVQVWYSP